MEKVRAFFKNWIELTRILEESMVDSISATVPWLAPIIPAYIAFLSMKDTLQFDFVVSVMGAIVIEFLGLGTVNTVFKLWDYNDSKRKVDPEAPTKVSIYSAGFYLIVVLVVNVILDIGKSPVTHIVAKALLSTLSVVAAVTLSIRSQHSRRLDEIELEKEKQKQERIDKKKAKVNDPESSEDSVKFSEDSSKIQKGKYEDYVKFTEENGNGMKPDEIATMFNVTERTAFIWKKKQKGG